MKTEQPQPAPVLAWHRKMKTIPGFEHYSITDDGVVYSRFFINRTCHKLRANPYELKQRTTQEGYKYTTLCRRGAPFSRFIHSLLLSAYVSPRPAGKEACHLNGIPSDNRLSNLAWVTHSENLLHKRIHGTSAAPNKGKRLIGGRYVSLAKLKGTQ